MLPEQNPAMVPLLEPGSCCGASLQVVGCNAMQKFALKFELLWKTCWVDGSSEVGQQQGGSEGSCPAVSRGQKGTVPAQQKMLPG